MRVRPTVRLLLLDPAHRLLLFQYEDAVALDPATPDLRIYWVTPGGGVEPGEAFAQAGLRELWEETGIRMPALGPCVWQRTRVLTLADGPVQCDERYYLAHVTDPRISLANLLAHERITYRAHRWWPLADIRQSDEIFFPPGLTDLLTPLLAGESQRRRFSYPAKSATDRTRLDDLKHIIRRLTTGNQVDRRNCKAERRRLGSQRRDQRLPSDSARHLANAQVRREALLMPPRVVVDGESFPEPGLKVVLVGIAPAP